MKGHNMKFTVFLSTDGKHTIQTEADEVELAEAIAIARSHYDDIVKAYGTKQEQAVKAYAKKEAFPNDSGNSASAGAEGIPMCSKHNKAMRKGKFGWYCSTPDADEPKGWCKQKSPVEFAREPNTNKSFSNGY